MKLDWTNNLNAEDAEQFKNTVLSARPVLERLNEIIEKDKRALDKSLENPDNYDFGKWDLRAADRNGYVRAMSKIQSLINLDQKVLTI